MFDDDGVPDSVCARGGKRFLIDLDREDPFAVVLHDLSAQALDSVEEFSV
jgi:hypothetical protein